MFLWLIKEISKLISKAMTTNLKYFLKYIDSKTYNMLKYIIEIILSDLVLTLNIMSTLHIDTRRRFNVDTTSYWC